MVNLVQAWAEHYRSDHPAVSVQVAGGGSGVGFAGLVDGTLDIAAASREITAAERLRVEQRRHRSPQEFTVALDALAVFVNRDNPLRSISIASLAEIYGENGVITRWSQLGVHNLGCATDEIIRVGRQNNSGTFAYFRDVVLGTSREYKLGSIDQSGSKDVAALVGRTPCAIGYSGAAFMTGRVRAVPVARRQDTCAIAPVTQAVLDGSYPLARRLYLYTAGEPAGELTRFIEWTRGREGRQLVASLGFVPASSGAAE
jgi:phosphate transport system substrate-binding protein